MRVLIGRERELAALAELVGSPATTPGISMLIRADGGVGKSSVLRAFLNESRKNGDIVLSAVADSLESRLEFGIVRRLFERVMDDAAQDEDGDTARAEQVRRAVSLLSESAPAAGSAAAAPDAAPDPAILNSLYWLTAALASRGSRVVVAIDDLQWADASSLLWLRYLMRRLDDLPVTVVATLGRGHSFGDERGIGSVLPLFRRQLTLAALGDRDVGLLVENVLGQSADEPFVDACLTATGGNPYLLHALLRSVRTAQLKPDADTAAQITKYVPQDVGRTVHAVICGAGADAVATAQAAAVLAGAATVDLIAWVTGLAEPAVEDGVHALERVGLMKRSGQDLDFICPVVSVAVSNDVLPSRRQALHARAARYLLDQGAPWDVVTPHLLLCPLGQAWLPDALRRAADEALTKGDPDRAVSCLQRALRENLQEDVRASVLACLGEAELARCVPTAVRNLQRGLELSRETGERTAAARNLAGALFALDRYPDGVEVLRRTREDIRAADPANALRLEIDLIYASLSLSTEAASVIPRLMELDMSAAEGTHVERPLAALLAVRAAMAGQSSDEVASFAQRALVDGVIPEDDESFVYTGALLALGTTGRVDLARTYADAAVETAKERGSAFMLAHTSGTRAAIHCRSGNVVKCQSDAEASLGALREINVGPRSSHSVGPTATLMDSLIKQGKPEAAEQLLVECGLAGELSGHWINDYTLLVRGRLRVAQGRLREALADFLRSGERACGRSMPGPGVLPWRSEAALAHAALGETERALALVEEELELARKWGVPEIIGVALRALGVITGGPEGLNLLQQAVRLLEPTAARYVHAQALADCGALERRVGRSSEARSRLQQAVSIAHECGAEVVADRALEELRAGGGRPRTRTFHGADALTPTERRVAGLAVQGMTNREIAEHLFVGLRTVEVHLTKVYGKLGISGRPGLAEALSEALPG
ncbi:helix-turn-helix transcriptional regulator [Wenjunlia tyrosinilytica]|uniref:helix-turn-helix transcriptional regulator n=1 Tax=Wenjunlia tyrosinilytica TaxID=1544741 RepID=UPI00166BD102|nr:AAA family ATPase [Wenjunlia tyrosinilytica]